MTRAFRPLRCAAPALLAVAALAAPAAAQQSISIGETVRGRLDSSDRKLDDNSYYDLYTFQGRAGQQVTITLRSDDFDAYLAVGSRAGNGCQECETDDDSADGTDSRITFSVPRTGRYEIRANSLGGRETGAYTLSLQEERQPVIGATPIRVGETLRGRLQAGDPTAGDDSYYDLYVVRGRPGQRVRVTMRSDDVDAYLGWGTLDNGEFRSYETDDDGAGGTDSRLEFELLANGQAYLRANSLGARETGAYTLRVESTDAVTVHGSDPAALFIRPGETVRGRLESSDAELGDGSYYDQYTFQGRAGEQVTITLGSDDFDTYLSFGQLRGGSYESIETDDDSGNGTDSQIRVTLPATGTYQIRANSLRGGATGAYTLRVESRR